MDEWVRTQNIKEFTDMVCLGGDGTIHLLISSMNKHYPGSINSFKFGVLPTGSRNALACELNSKFVKIGILNIIKGNSFKADLMKIKLEFDEVLATTAVCWGIVSDLCNEAQHYRF